jgi:ABC-type multidrug transport system fused ATPase/permease subunit
MVGLRRQWVFATGRRKALEDYPIVLALRVCLRAGPKTTIVALTLAVFFGIVPVALYVAFSLFVGEVARDPTSPTIAVWIVIVGVLVFAIQAGSPPLYQLSMALGRRVDTWVRERVMRAALSPPTVAHMETAQFRVAAELARTWESTAHPPSEAVVSLVEVTKAAVVAAGSAILLLQLSWWVPAVLAAGYVLMTVWGTRLDESADEAADAATGLRRAQYLREQAFEPASGREARLFGLGHWFRTGSDAQWQAAMRHVWDQRSATRGTAVVTIAVLIGSHLLVFAYIMQAAFQGLIGVTGAALFLQAAGGMVNLWLPWHVVALREATRPVRSLETLLFDQSQQPADRLPETAGVTGEVAANAPARGIEFSSVTYAYPSRPEPVFDGLALRIAAGTSLAIVGANGAGKTTLVKLLCGLLDPDLGAVRVDDVDLRAVRASWQRRVAVIFQDFVRYPFTVSDNIALGRSLQDPALIERAIERAGAAAMVADLPTGPSTVLSRAFGGVDLSGGQWQRLALARAIYAVERGATVLVLDEPTAQLDVRAEAALFDRFLDLTEGLTTVLISHRFSSVRHADRIVVLEAGRVVEDGSHDELVAAKGRYAAMFRVQARHFEDDDD